MHGAVQSLDLTPSIIDFTSGGCGAACTDTRKQASESNQEMLSFVQLLFTKTATVNENNKHIKQSTK